ncbi:MAG: LptF/LptG family permease [Saprospiraceae bacterium]|nr:LptF/LptG family permease [Saprospiraceae bacterium]
MKRIDWYLIRSFITPFVGTFFIALFVLILQVLWVYIDDIIGKGSSLLFILEMIFYLSMSLVPLALPIAVLISSVMVFGNLAERYELSSMKSAGISLGRVMRPLFFLVLGVSVFSFVCSNWFIPIANLKGKTRLYDVRKQKPSLNLEAGTFNSDFNEYVIFVGHKSDDGLTIYDVMVYPEDNSRQFQVITAKEGRFYTSDDGRFLIMELDNGHQYQETDQQQGTGGRPFIRTTFSHWEKKFDLGQFDLDRTDEESFKTNASVMTIAQINDSRDSVAHIRAARNATFQKQIRPYLPRPGDRDSALIARQVRAMPQPVPGKEKTQDITGTVPAFEPVAVDQIASIDSLPAVSHFLETFLPRDRTLLVNRARTMARSVQGEIASTQRMNEEISKSLAKYDIEVHSKFSLAAICLIFLLIGGSMGAIVRKGGFGYPMLIAIVFFIFFMIISMLFKNLAEKLVISPFLGAWMACLVLLPVGVFLTARAMKDAKIVDVDKVIQPVLGIIRRVFARSKKV